MPEPRRVHRARIEDELPQGREAGFSQECGIADPRWPDVDEAAVEHGPGRRWQLGLAFLRTGLPGTEKEPVGDLRGRAEVNTQFLAQPCALGQGEACWAGS
jgi:hypothetical protein